MKFCKRPLSKSPKVGVTGSMCALKAEPQICAVEWHNLSDFFFVCLKPRHLPYPFWIKYAYSLFHPKPLPARVLGDALQSVSTLLSLETHGCDPEEWCRPLACGSLSYKVSLPTCREASPTSLDSLSPACLLLVMGCSAHEIELIIYSKLKCL